MSDTPMIRPAMTPEEWEGEPATFVGTCPKVGIRASVLLRPRDDNDNVDPQESHVVSIFMRPGRTSEVLNEENRLAMAALCLHGHPQGFTRADVALIRSRFDLSDDQWRTDEESAAASLAARIEALLPPEGA